MLAPQRGLIAIDPKTSAPEADLYLERFCTRRQSLSQHTVERCRANPRLPQMSNFYCLPGRAGGSPNVLVSLLSRCRGRRIVAPATNDTQALSAVTAVAHFGQNREILILSHGGVAPARQELRPKGSSLWGTIAHFRESFGDRVLPAALQILAGHKVPSNQVLRHAVPTQKCRCITRLRRRTERSSRLHYRSCEP